MPRHDVEDLQLALRPITALVDEYPPDYVTTCHSHTRAQLLYASTGVMAVVTDHGAFVVPPQRAVWIPNGVRHEMTSRGAVALRTLYVDPRCNVRLPTTCRVIEVSALMRALILEAVTLPLEYDLDGRDGLVMALLLDEIATVPSVPLSAPMPTDERIAQVCRAMFKEPARERSIEELARAARMSVRTFRRRFSSQTGMSVAAWRQHVRLLEALSRLAIGRSVTEVALQVGYHTPSAFTAMFRRAFGTTPSKYFDVVSSKSRAHLYRNLPRVDH
jgi:AraC-like DNA-binding protein